MAKNILYLASDDDGWQLLSSRKPKKTDYGEWYVEGSQGVIYVRVPPWQVLYISDIRLPKGGGPIRVKLVEVKD